jgi:hypothetical protein
MPHLKREFAASTRSPWALSPRRISWSVALLLISLLSNAVQGQVPPTSDGNIRVRVLCSGDFNLCQSSCLQNIGTCLQQNHPEVCRQEVEECNENCQVRLSDCATDR